MFAFREKRTDSEGGSPVPGPPTKSDDKKDELRRAIRLAALSVPVGFGPMGLGILAGLMPVGHVPFCAMAVLLAVALPLIMNRLINAWGVELSEIPPTKPIKRRLMTVMAFLYLCIFIASYCGVLTFAFTGTGHERYAALSFWKELGLP